MSGIEQFVQQIINGIMSGSVYVLVAVGFALVWSTMTIVNMAHSEVVVVGAFTAMVMVQFVGHSMPIPVVILLALLSASAVAMIVGMLTFRLTIRPLLGRPLLTPILATLGVSILLQSLVARIFGAEIFPFPQLIPTHYYQVSNIGVTLTQIVVLGVSVLLILGIKLLLDRTKIGLGLRSMAQDRATSDFLGLNINRAMMLVMGLASAIGGIGGLLLGILYYSINPFMGVSYGLKGMLVMLIGGAGRIEGAIIAGLGLGIVESLTVGYISSTYRDAIAYGVILVVLVVRPHGLLKKS